MENVPKSLLSSGFQLQRKRRLSSPKEQVANYLVHGSLSAAAYANFVGIPKVAQFLMSHLSLVKMNATENGPLVASQFDQALLLGKEKFPIVIFSHGLGGSRTANAVICKELASFGFIVLCPEHTDGSASYAVLPSGLKLNYQKPSPEMMRDAPTLWRFRHRQIRHRAVQVLRLIEGLDEMNELGVKGYVFFFHFYFLFLFLLSLFFHFYSFISYFIFLFSLRAEIFKNRLDTSQICLMGHSFGAGTVIYSSLLRPADSRIKAVVAYDACMYLFFPFPFLIF